MVAESVHPEYRQILATFLDHLEPELVTVAAPRRTGRPPTRWPRALTDQTAAVVFQYPNFFGQLEDVAGDRRGGPRQGALAIVSRRSDQPGPAQAPGDYGADIVVAEGQSLGNPLSFGGPYLGIMACREEYVRKMPGRIVGQTTDRNGKRCWVLTLQTREQHIRREKATSNICTNQGLLALRASIYLAVMGPGGLRQAAELSTRKAHYAAERLAAVPGLSLAFPGPFFKEFVVRCKQDPARRPRRGRPRCGYHGGIALGRWYPELADCILIAVTEKRTRAEIDGLAEALSRAAVGVNQRVRDASHRCHAGFQTSRSVSTQPTTSNLTMNYMYKLDQPPLLFESSRPGRARPSCRGRTCPTGRLSSLIPAAHRADAPPPLPELSELDVVRHYTNLSTLNMSIDSNFYPLGSCTMKYNPKRNERLAGLPGLAAQHPYQDESTLQGLLAILFELQEILAEIAGLHAVSLQPAAGAQGELTALLVAAAYFRDRGETRTQVLDPRQCPRHQPRLGPSRRLRGGHDQERQPRPGRPRRLQGQARATRRPCS